MDESEPQQLSHPRKYHESDVFEEVMHNDQGSPTQLPVTMYNQSRQINEYIQSDNSQRREFKRGSFDSVAFEERLKDFDSKYVYRGKYDFENLHSQEIAEIKDNPVVDGFALPRLHFSQSKDPILSTCDNRKAPDQHSERRLSQESRVIGSCSSQPDYTDREDSSDASMRSENSPAPNDPEKAFGSSISSPRKRKREQWTQYNQPTALFLSGSVPVLSPNDVDPAPSTSNSVVDSASPAVPIKAENQFSPTLVYGKIESLTYIGNDNAFIQTAQVLADQVILESDAPFEPPSMTTREIQLPRNSVGSRFNDPLSQIISRIFPHCKNCDLKSYTALYGSKSDTRDYRASTMGQVSNRTNIVQTARSLKPLQSNIFKLEAPYTCVRRAGTLIEVSSSALTFWEELGLAPAYGTKDVSAFCIFPAHEYIQDGVRTFLSMMSSAYQSCKLGSHDKGSLYPEYFEGLVPVAVNGLGVGKALQEISSACERFGKRLAIDTSLLG